MKSIIGKRLYVNLLAFDLLLQIVTAVVPNVYTYYPEKADKHFVIGGILPVHDSFNGSCGHINNGSIQFVEAISYVTQRINAGQAPLNLSGVKLGFQIYDSCATVNIALQQTLRLLTSTDGNGVSAVIGDTTSSVTIPIANLLQLFHVPLISFAATTPSLSDKTQYGYFARTISSDNYQARAMADLAVYFNWSYIVAVNSGDVYGQSGIKGFINNFQNVTMSRCIASDSIEIPYPKATASDYDAAVSNLATPYVSNATVVVLFAQLVTVNGLLDAVQRRREHDDSFATKQFVWVGTDTWTTSLDQRHYDIARNVIGFVPQEANSSGFDEYFQRLHISNETDNPWFAEFWESYFGCSLNGTNPALSRCNVTNQRISSMNGYTPNSYIPNCIDAVYAIAYAVRSIQQTVCNGSGLCNATRSSERNDASAVDGRLLLQNILKVNFTSESSNYISFDINSDPTSTVFTLKYVHEGKMSTVGTWDGTKSPSLQLDASIAWNQTNPPPKSFCSESCANGQFQEAIKGQSDCCWNCLYCIGTNSYSNGKMCMSCAEGMKTNLNMDGCVQIQATYFSASNAWAIASIAIACIGFLVLGTSITIFLLHFNNKITKASSRELTSVLLIGIFFCYLAPFFYITEPSLTICGIRRSAVGVAFSTCFSPILVRVIRIYRIFNLKSSASTLRYVNPLSQVTFSALLIFIQIVISMLWLVIEPPTVKHVFGTHSATIVCGEMMYAGLFITLGYNGILLLFIMYFAFRTRNVPENYNETKFINLTIYSLAIIWIAFIVVYYGTLSLGLTFHSISHTLAAISSASVILGCLVIPKMYILIRTKLKNNPNRNASAVDAIAQSTTGNAMVSKEMSVRIDYLQQNSVNRVIQHDSMQFCNASTQTDN